MIHSIFNDCFTAKISCLGAELKSFREESRGTEYIWQGDSGFWWGSAPILFPVVGRLRDGKYTLDGREYEMAKHGLARTSEFSLYRDGKNEKSFILRSGPESRAVFPFEFEFVVTFTIEPGILSVSYTVQNTGDGDMYFTLGSHPAFSLPLRNWKLEDYSIKFEKKETLDRYFLEEGLLCAQPERIYLKNEDTIVITEKLFEDDALIFKNIKSRQIHLINAVTGLRLTLDTGGAPHLGIWAKPGAPFVCLEPWYGHDDPVDSGYDLKQKSGIIKLDAKGEYRAGYRIILG